MNKFIIAGICMGVLALLFSIWVIDIILKIRSILKDDKKEGQEHGDKQE